MPTPEIEQEGTVSNPGEVVLPAQTADNMSFSEKVTVGVLSTFGTFLLTMLAWVIARRNKENKQEDFAWYANQKVIKDHQERIDSLQKQLAMSIQENDVIRSQRNNFEAANTRALADLDISTKALVAAKEALERNVADLQTLQVNWEKAQRYIRVLRSAIVKAGGDIPPEEG